MKSIANPLSKMIDSGKVIKMFGAKTGIEILTKPVYKYTHKSIFDNSGIKR